MQFFKDRVKQAKNFILGDQTIFKDDEINDKMYTQFREVAPLKKMILGPEKNHHSWRYYDFGDVEKTPIVLIPPAGGSADVFFKLVSLFPGKGLRVISIQNPDLTFPLSWIEFFSLFLDSLHLKKVHLLGAGLGGFLAQQYACAHSDRVLSLILINSYASNTALVQPLLPFQLAPAIFLRNYMARKYQEIGSEANLASVTFYKKHMDDCTQSELFAHMNLEMGEASVDKKKINQQITTIIESNDFVSLPPAAISSLTEAYPSAKYVQLKTGGDFPYISENEEVALHVIVHLRRVDPTFLPAAQSLSRASSSSKLEEMKTDSSSSASSSSDSSISASASSPFSDSPSPSASSSASASSSDSDTSTTTSRESSASADSSSSSPSSSISSLPSASPSSSSSSTSASSSFSTGKEGKENDNDADPLGSDSSGQTPQREGND